MQAESIQITVTTTIVNFLSSMHMYLEHTGRHLKHADEADEGNREASWDAARHAEFDDYFAYKFLYELRNYVQHRDLPVHAWRIDHSLKDAGDIADRVSRGEPPLVEGTTSHDATISISLSAEPSELLRDPKIGKHLKQDIEGLTTNIDISEQIHVGIGVLDPVGVRISRSVQARTLTLCRRVHRTRRRTARLRQPAVPNARRPRAAVLYGATE